MKSIVKLIYHECANAKNANDIPKYKLLRPIREELISIQNSLKHKEDVNIWLENKVICNYLDTIIEKKGRQVTKLTKKLEKNRKKLEELCFEIALLNFYIGEVMYGTSREIGFGSTEKRTNVYNGKVERFVPQKDLLK